MLNRPYPPFPPDGNTCLYPQRRFKLGPPRSPAGPIVTLTLHTLSSWRPLEEHSRPSPGAGSEGLGRRTACRRSGGKGSLYRPLRVPSCCPRKRETFGEIPGVIHTLTGVKMIPAHTFSAKAECSPFGGLTMDHIPRKL